MSEISLSFCIPTYNRAQSVTRLVAGILSYNDPSIEVVVLDNGSTDDTLSLLKKIQDKRLCVYGNGENKGALFNMINVLNKGRGRYLVYSTDQDYVDEGKIAEFKSFLLQNAKLSCGFCSFDSEFEATHEIFSIGYQSIRNIAYKGRHPTGYFFKNELLKAVNIVENYSNYNFVDLFPLEFIFADLCLMGNGAIYHRSVFTPETGEMVVKHKSSTTNGMSNGAFFTPNARLKLAVNYSCHLNNLELTSREKSLLTANVFVNELIASTLGYRAVLGNENLCAHYGMAVRGINPYELFLIALNFYSSYVGEVSKLNAHGVTMMFGFRFKLDVLIILFEKFKRRFFGSVISAV
jgi:glycosyltransferase involved in cell wall biosynthesis